MYSVPRRTRFFMPACLVFACLIMCVPAAAAAPLHLKVGTLPYVSNSILEIAQREGFFAEQGLDVDLISFTSASDLIPLLLKGELDIATPALTAGFFNAIARGGKFRMVLPLTDLAIQDPPTFAFLARRADVPSRIQSNPASWKGLKISQGQSGTGTTRGFLLERALKSAGLGPDDVKLMSSIDLTAQADVLKSGQVDIVYTAEPWVTRLKSDKDIVILMPAEPLAPGMLASMIVYSKKTLDNYDAGTRFAVAFLKAVRQYRLGKTPRNVEIVARYTGLEPSLVATMGWSHCPADGHIDTGSVMEFQRWLNDLGLLDRVMEPDKFFDPRFSAAAARIMSEQK